ncbi:MAG: enoyl-CoA hydratase/isomerase family protein [Anaerolineae bacterium]
MSYETILFSVEEDVATIVLNRPERLNALNQKMAEEMRDAIQKCADDPGVRAVVIKGAGRAFSSGGDLKAMKEAIEKEESADFFKAPLRAIHELVLAIRNLPKPVLASINGVAAGAGLNMALACDLRIAAESAKFTQAFVNVGLIPDASGTYFLPRLIGLAKATQLFFSGEIVDAHQAEKLGLVNKVVADDRLEEATWEWATRLARGPTQALGRMKELLNQSLNADLKSQLKRERQAQQKSGETEDFIEGLRAFFEKREPRFQGR